MGRLRRILLLAAFVGFLVVLYSFGIDLVAGYGEKRLNDASSRQRILSTLDVRKKEWEKYSKLSEGKPKIKRLPDVIGIGAKKCGTDAIISFLKHHPFVKTPNDVEAFFFNGKYKKGLKFYRNMMPRVADHEIVMEKTPAYFDSPPISLPNRIKQDLPKAKLILVLCDPVNRSFSDYTHERVRYKLFGPAADMVADYPTYDSYLDVYLDRVNALLSRDNMENLAHHMQQYQKDRGASGILTTGFYSVLLPRWTALFDSKQLLILNGEDLLNDPGSQVERMEEYLGIPKLLLASDFVRSPGTGLFCVRPWWKHYNFDNELNNAQDWHTKLSCLSGSKGRTRHANGSVTATKKHMTSLRELYRPFNEELYGMTGIRFGM